MTRGQNHARVAVAALTLSASAFVALVRHEGYTGKAVIPTTGDVPTVGFGSTRHEDGRAVQLGDTTTPVDALQTAIAHISKDEAAFRASLPGVALTQGEYDVYLDFVYQYGVAAWRASAMRQRLLAGQHRQACDALLGWRFITDTRPHPGWQVARRDAAGRAVRWRFDCATPGNKTCAGVWARQQKRHADCIAAQPEFLTPEKGTP